MWYLMSTKHVFKMRCWGVQLDTAAALASHAGKSTLRMAELAALALRALAAGNAPNQDTARGAGAAPLLVALLNPTQNRHMAEERKARKENAAAAAARALLALAEGNEAAKVSCSLHAKCRCQASALPHMATLAWTLPGLYTESLQIPASERHSHSARISAVVPADSRTPAREALSIQSWLQLW